jgi:hypothetical protein
VPHRRSHKQPAAQVSACSKRSMWNATAWARRRHAPHL